MEIANLLEEENKERSASTDSDAEVSSVHIPADIVFSNILTRVPVKSLLRFRSVSKNWRSSIRSNSSFFKMHLNYSLSHPDAARLLVLVRGKNSSLHHFLSMRHREGGDPITHLLTLSTPAGYTISNNINGFSCFHPVKGSVSDDNCAYICNPSTREIITLPPNPTWLYVSYSFGIYPSNKFKVLSVHTKHLINPKYIGIDKKVEGRFYIIGNRARSWRQINPILPYDVGDLVLSILFGQGICVGGIIHWMLPSERTMLTFCLRDEKFGLMPLPEDFIPQDSADICTRGVILVGGRLTITLQGQRINPMVKNLWILEDYKNQVWVKKRIAINCPYAESPYLIGSVHIGILFLVQPKSSGFGAIEDVVYYDIEAKTYRRFQLAQLPIGYEVKLVTAYAESLLSLRMR